MAKVLDNPSASEKPFVGEIIEDDAIANFLL